MNKLIEQYLELTKICFNTDYSNKKSVRKNNNAVDRMYNIADKIANETNPKILNDFVKLLDITENKTNVWAAVHLLERIKVDSITEKKAFKIITQIAKGHNTEAMGFKEWIKDWNKLKKKQENILLTLTTNPNTSQ